MFQNVVVGADESDGAAEAVDQAIAMLSGTNGTLHIVSAFKGKRPLPPKLPDEFRYSIGSLDPVDVLLRQLGAKAIEARVRAVVHPVLASPVEAIARVAEREKADLIIVGSTASHGPRHPASVPSALIEMAQCAVLVV